jgi:pimeloyl-ACP methyl ester carboxylesterase
MAISSCVNGACPMSCDPSPESQGKTRQLLRGVARSCDTRSVSLRFCMSFQAVAFGRVLAEYRCIVADLRNANGGQSSGPLEIDRPWDSHTDDHLGLMDHLGIDKFMVLGFCIGGPFISNLLKRAADRIVAAVLAQPSGSRPEARDFFYDGNMKNWGPELIKRRPDLTMETVDKFLTRMYRTDPDFVFTVSRDFVPNCPTPVLILPDDVQAHPYAVAMEAAMPAPKAQVSMFPWKEPKERIPLAVRQIHSFLKAHRPASA